MLDASVIRFSLCASTLLLATSCLTPPCQCAQGAAAPGAPAAAGVAPSAATAAAAPTGGDADKAIIWDGDENGLTAKGWQDCDKKPDCKATQMPTPAVGFNNSVGLKLHGEDPGWIGFGWNLYG